MASVHGDWEFWWEEGENGGANPGGSSGMRQISRGGKELLADGDFLSSEAFALSGKPIVFSHIVSKTIDVSLQSWVMEVCDGSVDKASTGVGRGEDLEGVIPKESWFSEIGGSTGVGMEITGINLRYWSLAAFN
jgi:hypothetical protein